ncbi:unnamed protein product, partial [Amoebophrya sp. A120]
RERTGRGAGEGERRPGCRCERREPEQRRHAEPDEPDAADDAANVELELEHAESCCCCCPG